MKTKVLPVMFTVRVAGDEPEILITTPARDLMRDTLDPAGMDIARYLNGPRAVNFAHDHGRLPVGKTVSLTKSAQGIRARFRWLNANPEVGIVREVFAEGVLGASVEFVPVEVEPRAGGFHYAKTVLTGWALTSNPANPECVRLVKSLGLGLGDDDDEGIEIDGDDLKAALSVGLGQVLASQVCHEVRRRVGRLWGAADEAGVLALEADDESEDDDGIELDAADVEAAISTALGGLVEREVRGALNALRGRVD